MGATGALVTTPGEQSPALLIAVLGPLVVFFVAFRLSRSFHEFIATADLRLITSIQAWRAGGLVFIALSAYEILPGFFAWPAGWGDIAIGVTAPWILLSLIRKPGFRNSTGFRVWNWLGIGPRRGDRARRTELRNGDGIAGRDHDRAYGAAAARVDSRVSRADFRDAAFRGAVSGEERVMNSALLQAPDRAATHPACVADPRRAGSANAGQRRGDLFRRLSRHGCDRGRRPRFSAADADDNDVEWRYRRGRIVGDRACPWRRPPS